MSAIFSSHSLHHELASSLPFSERYYLDIISLCFLSYKLKHVSWGHHSVLGVGCHCFVECMLDDGGPIFILKSLNMSP